MARNNDTREIALQFKTDASDTREQLNQLLTTLDKTSTEYKEVVKATEELEKASDKLNNALNDLDSTTDNTSNSIEGVEDALNSAISSLSSTISKSKELTNANRNSNKSFTELSESIANNSTVVSALDSITGGYYSTVKNTITGVFEFVKSTNLASVAQRAFSLVTASSSKALTVFKGALVSTGIGALVVALGYAVSKMMELADATNDVNKAFDENTARVNNLSKAYSELNEDLEFSYQLSIEKAKQAGASETELALLRTRYNKSRRVNIEDEIKSLKELNRNEKISVEDATKNNETILRLSKERSRIYNQELLEQERDRTSSMTKTKAIIVKKHKTEIDLEEVKKNRLARIWDLETMYYTDNVDKFRKNINSIMKQHTEDFYKNSLLVNKEDIDKANELVDNYYENLIDKQEGLLEKYKTFSDTDFKGLSLDYITDGVTSGSLSKEFYDFIEYFKELGEEIPEVSLKMSEFQKETEFRFNSLNDNLRSYSNLYKATSVSQVDTIMLNNLNILDLEETRALAELEILEASEIEKNAVIGKYTKLRLEEQDKAKDASNKIRDLEFQSYLAFADGVSGTLSGLSELSKEGSGIQKGLAIASVSMDAGIASISAYKGMVQTFPGPWGVAAGVAAASSALLQGAAQIKRIRSVRTDGTETGGTTSTVSAGLRPNVSFISSSDNQVANTIAETTGIKNDTPIKAYVVSKDVTTAQEMDRNAINANSL